MTHAVPPLAQHDDLLRLCPLCYHRIAAVRHVVSHPATVGEKAGSRMKPASPTVPPEAIEAYNLYIHGKIDRRSFLDRSGSPHLRLAPAS